MVNGGNDMAHELMSRPLWHPFDLFENDYVNRRINQAQADLMKTDIAEKDDRYEVTSEMPGVEKKDIKVRYREGILTISAEKHLFEDHGHGDLIHTERSSENMARSFRLPMVNEDKISAKYENGVLTVSLPKATKPEEDAGLAIDVQ
jgi:HSP20 family protein